MTTAVMTTAVMTTAVVTTAVNVTCQLGQHQDGMARLCEDGDDDWMQRGLEH
jgi:hypothetical protein